MRFGDWTLEGEQEKVVLWWTADGLARTVGGLSWDEALDLFARVLARYPSAPGRFLTAREDLGRLHDDGALLGAALELGHHVAISRPYGMPGARDAADPALIAFEDEHGGLRLPILTTGTAQAQEAARYGVRVWGGRPVRVFVGERGIRTAARTPQAGAGAPKAAAAQLAATQAFTALEEMADSAILTAAPSWAAKRPVIRRRPQEPWLDAHVRALDARAAGRG